MNGKGLLGAVTLGALVGCGGSVPPPVAAAPPGGIAFHQDFNNAAQGSFPEGWRGGAGMTVQKRAEGRYEGLATLGKRALDGAADGAYSVTIPWGFGGDYRAVVEVRPCGDLRVAIGNVNIQFNQNGGSVSVSPAWGNGDTAEPAVTTKAVPEPPFEDADGKKSIQEFGWGEQFWNVMLVREGAVHKLSLGNRSYVPPTDLIVARYEGLPDPDGITLVATCKFAVASVEVVGGPRKTPAASRAAPATTPKPPKETAPQAQDPYAANSSAESAK